MEKPTKELVEKFVRCEYEIHDDGSVSVFGNVYIYGRNLDKLPFKFKNIKGFFDCSYNQLTSLEGAPESVSQYFSCYNNRLTSLEGAPKSVGGNFYCSYNHLTSLEGAPKSVGGDFDCGCNSLTSLKGIPKIIQGGLNCDHNNLASLKGAPKSVGGYFNCSNNQLTSLKFAPNSVGRHFHCSNNRIKFSVQDYISRYNLECYEDGFIVYKRVSHDFKTQENTDNETLWIPGTMVKIPFWDVSGECGAGKFHACFDTAHCDNFRGCYRDKYIKIKVLKEDMHTFSNPCYLEKIAFREGFVISEVK